MTERPDAAPPDDNVKCLKCGWVYAAGECPPEGAEFHAAPSSTNPDTNCYELVNAPPETACHDFLEWYTGRKFAARDGRQDELPRDWTLVDTVIYWWENIADRAPEVKPVAHFVHEVRQWLITLRQIYEWRRNDPEKTLRERQSNTPAIEEIQVLINNLGQLAEVEPEFTVCPKCAGELITEIRCDGRCGKSVEG